MSGMKGWGIALTILGVLIAICAFLMGSTVSQDVPIDIGYSSITRAQQMHNLPRAQTQLLLFVGGCTFFLGGLVLAAIGELQEAIARAVGTSGPINHAAPSATPTESAVAEVCPVLDVSAEELVERHESAERAMVQERSTERSFIIGTLVLLGIVLAFIFMMRGDGNPTQSLSASDAANIQMRADDLERQADNLEALANEMQ